jgi:hypothetical protein
MTAYPAGPYTLEIPYVNQSISHSIEFNCDVIGTPTTGDAPDTVTLRSKDGAGRPLDDSANAIWGFIRQLLNTGTLASTYNLWKRNPDNNDKLFISGGSLSAPNGSVATASVLAWYAIYTWRSGNGGIAKVTVLEPWISANSRSPLASSVVLAVTAFNSWVLGDDNVIMARDRSFPVAPMSESYGQNDKLFERRFRS